MQTQTGVPVVLRINEAPYNHGSPITLISEYQVREHGVIIDSVSKRHMTAAFPLGTQQMILSSLLSIPFEDRGTDGF